jgi:hypothetical protein
MSTITTADKIWVIKREDEDLAYVSQIDSGHKKRKETATYWAQGYGGNGVGIEYDNVPTANIKFISSHTRYSTSNKVMQLKDPRGFECQIYIDNLTSIIKNVEISNGVIKTPLKWGRRSGNLYLMIPDEAGEAVKTEDRVSLSKIPVGSYYKKGGGLLKYLGRKKFKVTYYLWEKQLIHRDHWHKVSDTIKKEDVVGEPQIITKSTTLPISLTMGWSKEITAISSSTSIATLVEREEDSLEVTDQELKALLVDCVEGQLNYRVSEELDIDRYALWEYKEGEKIGTWARSNLGYIYKTKIEEIKK